MDEAPVEQNRVRLVPALVVLAISASLVLVAIEIASRILIQNQYLVWPPNFSVTFDAGDVIGEGVTFPAKLTINSIGLRGAPPADHYEYRILAIGGSTTICVYLDDTRAWPWLLQKTLNEELGREMVWVGNALDVLPIDSWDRVSATRLR